MSAGQMQQEQSDEHLHVFFSGDDQVGGGRMRV